MEWRALPIIWLIVAASTVNGQAISHSDVNFSYGDVAIEIERQDGRLVIPQVMPTSGFFAQSNTNPGFFSERDLGGGTDPNDIVVYNVLDPLIFWSNGEFSDPPAETEIRILNNPRSVDDVIIGSETGEQRASFDPLTNSIGQSSSNGEFHAHVDFRLEPLSNDPEEMPSFGAYGIKLSLSSDNAAVEESDPFFIVFQFGIDSDQLIEALDDFDELLTPSNALVGDFNADGILDAADIDLLSKAVVAGSNTKSFDISADDLVNELDRTKWVEESAGTHFGDADLNGNVGIRRFPLAIQEFWRRRRVGGRRL